MAMNGIATKPKSLALLEPHYQALVGGILPFRRDEVVVFFNRRQLGRFFYKFKLGHNASHIVCSVKNNATNTSKSTRFNFTSWQYLAVHSYVHSAEAHGFRIFDFAQSIIFSWSLNYRLTFFSGIWTLGYHKNIVLKEDKKLHLKISWHKKEESYIVHA